MSPGSLRVALLAWALFPGCGGESVGTDVGHDAGGGALDVSADRSVGTETDAVAEAASNDTGEGAVGDAAGSESSPVDAVTLDAATPDDATPEGDAIGPSPDGPLDSRPDVPDAATTDVTDAHHEALPPPVIVPTDAFPNPAADFDIQPQPGKAVAFQIDVAHSGFQPAAGLTLGAMPKWQHTFTGAISYPLIADGRVFVIAQNAGNSNPILYALDARSGTTVWQTPSLEPPGGNFIEIAYDRGRVFAVSEDGDVAAFDAATGSKAWGEHVGLLYGFVSLPIAAGGALFFNGPDGTYNTLFAMDEQTGLLIYKARALGDHPTLGNGSIFVVGCEHSVQALDAKTGIQRWYTKFDCTEGSGPVTPFVDGRLLVDTDGFDPLFVLDAASGAKLAEIDSSIVAAAAGGKAFVEQVHTLHAIDIATGVSAWAFDVPGLLTVPPIATEDFVVTLEGTGRLSALNRMTGALVRSYTLPGPTSSSLQGSTRGMGAGEGLLVVPFDTVLYAF